MRKLALSAAALLCAGDAMAADFLRGSVYEAPPRIEPAYYVWEGVYVGGQVGYTNADFDFTRAGKDLIKGLARHSFLEQSVDGGTRVSDWMSLGRAGASGVSYGGFVGYNSQWGEAVVGLELNYSRTSLRADKSDSLSRLVVENNYQYAVTTRGGAAAHITDFGSLRIRAGYAAGWFMPYVAAGVGFGQAEYSRYASVGYPQPVDLTPPQPGQPPRPLPPPYYDQTAEGKKGVVGVGYSVAAGVDVALFANAFLRFEYEHVALASFGGVGIGLNSFRTAAAVKF